jgi:oligopeptide transport system substrate-binding protein
MVKSWTHGTQITLVKNPDYWNTNHSGYSATPAYLDEIDYPIIRDQATQYLTFQKGTLGACDVPSGSFISSQQLPNVKSGTWSVNLYEQAATQFVGITWNKQYGASDLLPLRQALVYAADRNSVCKIGTQGVNLPSDLIVPLGMKGVVAGVNPYPYDPSKAQPLIDTLNSSGVKIPLPIPYWYNTGFGAAENAQILVAGWQKAMPSLNFKLSGLETNAYWTTLGKNAAPGLFRMGWVGDWPTLDDFIYLFTTTGGKTLSYTWYSNPQVDKLVAQARATVDQTQANDLYNQAQKVILTDAPCVPLFTYRQAIIVNNKYGGFNFSPYYYPNMWEIWQK